MILLWPPIREAGGGRCGRARTVASTSAKGVRYPSDLRDEEWALIASLIPPAKRGGRRREVDVREVMNGVLYVLETGCQWRALAKNLPP